MPISADHALRRGMISAKAHAKIGVKHPRTGPDYRMTGDMSSTATDSGGGKTGIAHSNKSAINNRQGQGTPATASGHPSRGSPQGSAPSRDAINERTGKRWPNSGKAKKQKRGFLGGHKTQYPSPGPSNYYGGPNNNAKG